MPILRELQLVECEMLKKLDTICCRHGIKYWVMWGTALGAVRHKGFIPWDDDVDVGMLRSDYDKFRAVSSEEWDGLVLIDGGDDCFYHEKLFPRLYKPGTILEPEIWAKYTYNKDKIRKPVWVDIFLFDEVPSLEVAKKKSKESRWLHLLWTYSKYQYNVVSTDSIKGRLKSHIKNLLHICFNGLGNPKKYAERYYKFAAKDASGEYVITYDSFTIEYMLNSMFLKSDLFPLQRVAFEDFEVFAPNNLDKYLTQLYGDYMTPPPVEKRFSHSVQTISL